MKADDGPASLGTRLMDQSTATVLAGTQGAADPFFSPDGNWIGFMADGQLKKVSVQGGAPTTICEGPNIRGADWGEDGNIVYGLTNAALMTVPESGGKPRSLDQIQNGDASQRWPQILPGGETILFTGHNIGNGFDEAHLEVLSLKTGTAKIVQPGGYYGRYLPTGHLVYIHQSTLFAVPFDLSRSQTRGMPAPVLQDVAGNPGTAGGQLSFSRTGTVVYLSGKSMAENASFAWQDASGRKEALFSGTFLRTPRISPDGKRLAFSSIDGISVYDFARGAATRLTATATGASGNPVWTLDGKHLIYTNSERGITWARSDGSGEPQVLFKAAKGPAVPESLSPDGKFLAFHQAPDGTGTRRQIWILPIDAGDPDHPKAGVPELFLATAKGSAIEPRFSPDGRWLAYSSNESGTFQIFVRPFSPGTKGGGQAHISTEAGRSPQWSSTAKEIFYLSADGLIMVAPYTVNGESFEPGKPRQWSDARVATATPLPNNTYDLAPDGKRFVVIPAPVTAARGERVNLHMTFLLNFFDFMKNR